MSLLDNLSGAFSKIPTAGWINLGIGAAGLLLAKNSKTATVNLAKVTAATQVALGVGQLLKTGATTIQEISNAEKGLKTSNALQPVKLNLLENPSSKDIGSTINTAASQSIEFIRYPADISSKYSIAFTFYEYEKFSPYKETSVKARDVIRLPIPSNLVDVLSLQYNSLQMGALRGPLAQGVTNFAGEIDKAQTLYEMGAITEQALENLVTTISNNPEALRVVGRSILQKVSPEASAAVDLALGNVPNPHQQITFNGVNLRSYQFSWRMSPNNERDARELKKLIFTMKSKTLPRREGPFLLKYPDYVRVKLYPSLIHDFFNFRTMVVDSFLVNYAPSGNVSFLADDMPSEVEITMTLREVDIQTSEDYAEGFKNSGAASASVNSGGAQ